MRVVQLSLFHTRVPLRKRIRHASHVRTETENIVARCVLEDGSLGYGEGVPREYVTGETVESGLDLLKRSDLPGQLDDCPDFESAIHTTERLQLAPVPGDERHCMGNAARCAVELALLDAYGRHFGESLSSVTRILTPEIYQPREQVRYSGAITSASGWKARVRAWTMWVFGFRDIKVKVGISGQKDVKRLRIIRSRLGKHIDIRLDANEAWSPEEATDRIRELEPYQISSVEQPLHQKDNDALPMLRKQVSTPIMLDESFCGITDAEQAVAHGWCDLFNIRLSKCGGFIPSLRLVEFARAHGIGYQLGCQVGETAILSAAGRHFACSVADLKHIEGSYDGYLVREPLGDRNLTFGWGGVAASLSEPGLGVGIDPEALHRVTVTEEVILG